jgi:hypothetical protein
VAARINGIVSAEEMPQDGAEHSEDQPHHQTNRVDNHKIFPIACLNEVETRLRPNASHKLKPRPRCHTSTKHYFTKRVTYNFSSYLELP